MTPGWVDIHTHYDGQATWDEVLAPRQLARRHHRGHRATAASGSRPARPDRHEWLIGLMEGVEDIPGTALAEGIDWEWETFPEYLDALDQRKWTIDVGTQIAHGAVRSYVMGDRGARNEPATPEDIEAMKQSWSRRRSPPAPSGSRPRGPSPTWPSTASRCRAPTPPRTSCSASASALGELGAGVFELAPAGVAGEDIISPAKEVDWMRRLSAAIHRPVTFALVQVDAAPDLWRESDGRVAAGRVRGRRPLAAGGGPGDRSAVGALHHLLPLRPHPGLPGAEGQGPVAATSSSAPSGPRRCVAPSSSGSPTRTRPTGWTQAYRTTFVLGDPPEYEPGPERSLAGVAAAAGRTPLEVAYDAMLGDDGTGPALRADPQLLRREPRTGPRDAASSPVGRRPRRRRGALRCHLRRLQPTFMLTHWTRDRQRGERLPLEWMVKKQTHDTARLYGLGDRGTLEAGMLADLNLIDYDALQLGHPIVVSDLPAGGSRLVQRATGYVATIKSGVMTFDDGVDTGARPGRLVRGPR